MKKIFSVFFCFVLLFIVPQNTPANSFQQTFEETPHFIQEITNFFSNPDCVTVVDKNGNVITEQFYKNNYIKFIAKDFKEIKNYFLENVKYFQKSSPIKDFVENKSSKMGRTKVISDRFYEIVTSKDTDHRFELDYVVSGKIVYDMNTGKISSAYDTTIEYIYGNIGADWTLEPTNLTTSYRISSDKYYAYFTGGFHLYATLRYNSISLRCDYGYHSGTVRGNGD